MATTRQRIKVRRDTAANWSTANPVLAAGEIGYETDTKQAKVGDGTSNWSALEYAPWNRNPLLQSIQLLTATPPAVSEPGQIAWNADEGTLELGKLGGVSNYVGAETMVLCRNASNTTAIPKGTAVMFAGTLGASGRLKVQPMIANGSVPGYVFFGVTDQAIAGASDGYVTVFGKIRGINTSAYQDGDILWCNPAVAGGFTKVEPQAPNLKLAVAAVVRAGNNGTIFVRWTTGARLKDLHDVEANGSTSDGDVLAWNQASQRWQPANASELAGGLPNGGDPGNVLLKKTTANHDAEWVATLDGGTFN